MSHCKAGTDCAEDQHASATCVGKFRPEITEAGMMTRAFLHTTARLLPAENDEEKEVRVARAQVTNLEKKQPRKTTGRHVFCGDLSHGLKKLRRDGGTPGGKSICRNAIKHHRGRWEAKDPARKATYERRARLHQVKQMVKISEDLEDARNKTHVALVRKQSSEARRANGPLFFRSCKWREQDLARMSDLMKNGGFDEARVGELRDAAVLAPPRPHGAFLENIQATHWCQFPFPPRGPALRGVRGSGLAVERRIDTIAQAMPVADPVEPDVLPLWVTAVARNREHFAKAAIVVSRVDGSKSYWKFMFALQQPMHISFSPLEPVEFCLIVGPEVAASSADDGVGRWRWTFRLDYMKHVAWLGLPATNVEAIEIIQGCLYVGNERLVSDANKRPLQTFLGNLPQKTGTTSTGTSAKRHKETQGRRNFEGLHPGLKLNKKRSHKPPREKTQTVEATTVRHPRQARRTMRITRWMTTTLKRLLSGLERYASVGWPVSSPRAWCGAATQHSDSINISMCFDNKSVNVMVCGPTNMTFHGGWFKHDEMSLFVVPKFHIYIYIYIYIFHIYIYL